MKKRLLAMLLAVVMVFSMLPMAAFADTVVDATFTANVDKTNVEAGDTITVTVTLDHTITKDDGATMLQGELYYDTTALEYVSCTPGSSYSFIDPDDNISNNVNAGRVQFNWFSSSSTPKEMAAGTVVTVVFTANEPTTAEAVETEIYLDMWLQTNQGVDVLNETYDPVAITVCPGHSYANGTCTVCGEADPDYVAPTYEPVTVYLTVSQDYNFIQAPDGTYMALEEVTVPYFDIALYGLESIYYNPDCYANGAYGEQVGGTAETAAGNITMLHLMIWATEVYYNGLSPEEAGKGWLANEGGWNGFSVGTNPGSAFINFWDFGGNVNYYLNYEYPLGAPGWGATCDQILIADGDVVTMRYNAWTGDDGYYHHFGETGTVTETVKQGEDVALTLYYAVENYNDYTTGHTPVGEGEYVYLNADDITGDHWDGTDLGTTDTNGQITISTDDLEPGTYYITSETHDPAVMILIVEENDHVHSHEYVVTEPTCTEGGYTTYTCSCGDTYTADETAALGHSYEYGTCTVCGAADPDYVAANFTVSVGDTQYPLEYIGNQAYDDDGRSLAAYVVKLPAGTTQVAIDAENKVYIYNMANITIASGTDPLNMPLTGAVTIYKVLTNSVRSYVRLELPSFDVTVNATENGTVTADKTSAIAGETVTLTVTTPAVDYTLKTLTVTAEDGTEVPTTNAGNGKYTFVMPESAVVVSAEFQQGDTESMSTITLGSVEAKPGETITVPVTAKNMTATSNQAFGVWVDLPDGWTITGVANGTATAENTNWTAYVSKLGDLYEYTADETDYSDCYFAVSAGDADVVPDGEVLVLTIQIPEDAAAGTYTLDMIGAIHTSNLTDNDVEKYPSNNSFGVLEDGSVTIEAPAHKHSYEAVVTAPTCTEGGYTTYTCSCGDTYTADETEALGHTVETWTFIAANPQMHFGTCTTCETTVREHHNTDGWTVTTEPTCTEAGVETACCTKCGITASETREIPALGHTEVIDEAVEATCTETGLTEGKHCEVCGEILVAQEEIAALGHSYENGTCTVCGAADPDYVAPSYEPVTVYFSASHDDQYMMGEGGVAALKEITVPYFDLALYGLDQFYFSSETYGDDGDGQPGSDLAPGTPEYAAGKITMLHLFIYATETVYLGLDAEEAGQGYLYDYGYLGTDVLTISGSQGSSFMDYFWGYDMNLNYYLNYEYPLASEGWGATSDQILLQDGDIVTLGHFLSYSFFNDSTSIFNYIVADDATPAQGEEVTLTLYCAGPNMGNTDGTAQNLVTYMPDVYYISLDELNSGDVTSWNYLGSADENGEFVLDTSDLEPGQYIVAMPGQYGVECPDEIVSTPGGVILTVEENGHVHNYEAVVTEPTCTEGGYTTYTCECGDSYVADETDALGHDEVIDEAVAATCTTSGLTEGKHCDRCGETLVEQEEIAALGHTEETVAGHAATCTEAGLTDGVKCSVCGEILVEQEEIPATGHNFEDGVCTECGEEEEASVPAAPVKPSWQSWFENWFGGWWDDEEEEECDHSYTSVVTDPTCTDKGYTTHTCEKCGDSYKDSYTDALGHNYEDGVCTNCGAEENKKPGWSWIWFWPFW